MDCAIIKDGIVSNIIVMSENAVLNRSNESKMSNIVPIGDVPVGIGDTYDGEYFYHDGERVLTELERIEHIIIELDSVLLETQYQNLIGGLE